MIIALLTGRSGSKSIPKKNISPILGRPLTYYPMFMAKQSKMIDEVYVSTDDDKIKNVANDLDIKVIDRPIAISQDSSELVDAILHSLEKIPHKIDILVTMHCNCAVHLPNLVDDCINKLMANPEADSCVSGYIDNSVHPYRTKQIDSNGYLNTWMKISENISSNRQNLSSCFILDGAVRALRVDRCFPPNGQRPFNYLGEKILPIENISGGDIHSVEDIIYAEDQLIKLGWEMFQGQA